MLDDSPGSTGADEGPQFIEACFGNALQTPEVSKQPRLQLVAHSGDRCQLAFEVAHRSALPVIGDREPVSLVANHLNQMQHRRMMINSNRLFSAFDEQEFFTFRD